MSESTMNESTMTNSATACCEPGCGSPAEWAIFDEADRAPDAGTEACTRHVGDLLGRRPCALMDAPFNFRVCALKAQIEEVRK